MSLRFRLIALVIVALTAGLAFGGVVTLVTASRSVRAEMRSALVVAQQTADNVIRTIDVSADPRRDLDDLIASFGGNRHLRVWLVGGPGPAEVRPVDDRPPFGSVPSWFARWIGVKREARNIPVMIGGHPFGTVVIQTDPRNEILEVWDELSGSLVLLLVFASATIPLIYLLVGRTLRPLGRLARAMEQVGQGDYAIRLDDRLTPELARLRDSFNLMAARLAATDADNRRLHEQLLTLQEEERNDIARDLHDEIGPFLFAINVDIANLSRLLKEGRAGELAATMQSITEAARHLQRQVRGMLSRLRPIRLAELGLVEAIGGLIEFWRRRYPDIEYRATVAPDSENLGDRLDTTMYRVVQECLSNAVRHGQPRLITVSVRREPSSGGIVVDVTDDGTGTEVEPAMGYGLIGMEERVRAVGGRLRFANLPSGGFSVSAVLPLPEGSPNPAPTPKLEPAQ